VIPELEKPVFLSDIRMTTIWKTGFAYFSSLKHFLKPHPYFKKSIGIDFKIKRVEVNDMKFKMQIWDTAGQERFRTITAAYYKAASGILLCCDMTNEASLGSLDNWVNQIKMHAPEACLILVGTKNDLEAKVPVDVLRVWANERDMPFVSTSAKTGNGVTETFMRLLKEVILLNKNDFGRKKENKEINFVNNPEPPLKKNTCSGC